MRRNVSAGFQLGGATAGEESGTRGRLAGGGRGRGVLGEELAQEPLPPAIVNLIEQDSTTTTHDAQPEAPTAGTDDAGSTPADPTPRDKDDG